MVTQAPGLVCAPSLPPFFSLSCSSMGQLRICASPPGVIYVFNPGACPFCGGHLRRGQGSGEEDLLVFAGLCLSPSPATEDSF